MGGYSSTRWNSHRTRPDTGSLLKLDAAMLSTRGALAPGAIAWHQWTDTRGDAIGSIHSMMSRDQNAPSLTLVYRVREHGGDWHDIRERIELEATPCNYGGVRLWLTCPDCQSRRRVLYSLGGRFRCRQCHNLAYRSTREDAHDRSIRRTRTLHKRLAASPSNIFTVPPKPRGMRWDTYEQIADNLYHEHRLQLGLLEARYEKIEARTIAMLARYEHELGNGTK
jgi:hypothetical protein